jgi:antitoxin component YwqK of YwqJK toxin-antitoxin module
MLRVNIDDPNLIDIGFDGNGDLILAYNGIPFTGIEEEYYKSNPQQLLAETEYQNGHMLGICREYHLNGQLKMEYTKGKGGFDGTFKTWDTNGILLTSSLWIAGEKQP